MSKTQKDLITNFLFVHIPKTGGTSVTSALGNRACAHNTPAKIRAEIGDELWNSCFKFTFIRNPWDRAVSFYEFHKEDFRAAQKSIVMGSFGAWVLDGMKTGWRTDWITPDQKNDPVRMDQFLTDDMFVGRFESLAADFNYVCRQIGLPIGQLPHINASKREKDYRTYYQNDRIKELVAERNKYVIDKFGYTF
jgi:hypothetical protein